MKQEYNFYVFIFLLLTMLGTDKYLSSVDTPQINQSTVDKPLHTLKLNHSNRERAEFLLPTTKDTTIRKELSNWNNIEVISPLLE